MPHEMGRPPRSAVRYGERFEELDYNDEDDGQGVYLDQDPYAARTRSAHAGDELYFDGYDLGQHRRYDERHVEGYDSAEEDSRQQKSIAFGGRDREDALIHTALDRIAKARARGKTNVNLSQEEMEALERRRDPPPEPVSSLASPPPTPAKSKGKGSSRTNSSTSLATQKPRKKAGSISSPAKSNSKAKVARKTSGEQTLPYLPPGPGAPGIMVPGPNGVPIYAPIVYGSSSPELLRAQPRSRSTSKHSRREATPERNGEQAYASYSPRYYPPQSGVRPPSSSSSRSLQDDQDWYPPPTRNRSTSNAQGYPAYRLDDYDSMSAAHARRNVSGPPDIRYASLRRAPPSSSPLAPRPAAQHSSHSDPTLASARKPSGLGRAVEFSARPSSSDSGSGSGSSDDQGVSVQVNILPDAGSAAGYEIKRVPVPVPVSVPGAAVVSGNESRKRRSGRR